jgi:glutamate synthase (NADPH/NADH) small chain
MGVKMVMNCIVGRTITMDQLQAEFDAVFIGTGAGVPLFLGVPGEDLNGVYSANEFLTRVNLMKAYEFPKYKTPVRLGRKAVVIGGGNVAMDAARCSLRLGCEKVTLVYRRTEVEMPARVEEVQHAREEGIVFDLLSSPHRILGSDEGRVCGIECIRQELSDPGPDGRRRPVPIEGSNYIIECDSVIVAIGQRPNKLLTSADSKLETRSHGQIVVDDIQQTTRPGVFAGGDVTTGAATVILAVGAGKKAAMAMHEFIQSKKAAEA